jgi:hypothetical protein
MSEDLKRSTDEIKVTDTQSFTQSGERRAPDLPKSEPKREKPAPARSTEAATAADPHAIGFENFIRYLAQVALHQMAGERNPATGVVEVSLEEARQTIEILGMLKEKTKGNLSGEEQGTLEDLLYHLKVEFSRRAAAPRR